ncbi:MAG: alpha/beta fold hydrolase [Pirellula sp.]
MIDESEIFMAASQIANAELRERFLVSACDGNEPLRRRIDSLLEQFASWQGAVDRFIEELPERVSELGKEQVSAFGADASFSKQSPQLDIGSKIVSYEIRSHLGSGGMGEVYVAYDWRLDRQVALKILSNRHSANENWVSRFYREAKMASSLNHPNILTVHEVGEFAGFHFIATELVEGKTLRECIALKRWSLADRCNVGAQVADALAVAHEAGVIHRDVKPDNVMVRPDGLVKVLDFGLAKVTEQTSPPIERSQSAAPNKTDPGLIMGTMRYMSPEQARRQPADAKSDIFSFGILLYELLTLAHPFAGANEVDAMAAILQKTPNSMRSLVPSIPVELDQLVMRMLRKEPRARAGSMSDVAAELRYIGRQLPQSEISPYSSLGVELNEDSTRAALDDTNFDVPEVRYARSGDVNIAYQVLGSGEIDMVFVMGWVSHLDWFWKEPSFARFLKRLSSVARLILFDKRGTGLSDRVEHDQLPTLEQRMEDVHAVMDAVGSEKAVLCGVSEGGPMCSLFAASYPHRTLALVMIGSYARRIQTDGYPWGPTPEQHLTFLEEIRRGWGGPVGIEQRAPSAASDPAFRSWWATYLRMGASPGAALALTKMNSQIDVRPILKSIQVPTLVVHRRGDQCLKFEEGEFLANQIPGATLVALDGSDHLPFVGNQEEILQAIEKFLAGARFNSRIRHVLATVLVAKLSGIQSASDSLIKVALSNACRDAELFRGKCFAPNSQMMIASFDGPTRALRAAVAIRDSSFRLGTLIQIGLHTGECELSDDTIAGSGVEMAKSIADRANPNAILASGTVRDLVAGCEIEFRPHDIPPEQSAPTRLFLIEN